MRTRLLLFVIWCIALPNMSWAGSCWGRNCKEHEILKFVDNASPSLSVDESRSFFKCFTETDYWSVSDYRLPLIDYIKFCAANNIKFHERKKEFGSATGLYYYCLNKVGIFKVSDLLVDFSISVNTGISCIEDYVESCVDEGRGAHSKSYLYVSYKPLSVHITKHSSFFGVVDPLRTGDDNIVCTPNSGNKGCYLVPGVR